MMFHSHPDPQDRAAASRKLGGYKRVHYGPAS